MLSVCFFEIGFNGLRQRLVACFVALHNLSATLGNDDNVIVFVLDVHHKMVECGISLLLFHIPHRLHVHTAIYLNNLSTDVARHIGSKESGTVGNVIYCSTTTQRNFVCPLFAYLLG